MKMDEFAKFITNKENYQNDENVFLEFPGLCGRSSLGSAKHHHGHLPLSVSEETVKQVAFEDTHITALFIIPRTMINRILDKNNNLEIDK